MFIKKNLIIIISLIFIFSCSGTHTKKKFPIAKNGVIDFSGWDFAKDGTVELKGEWVFYWNELVNPEDYFIHKQPSENKPIINVPGAWKSFLDSNGKEVGECGCATYVLQITGLDSHYNERLALYQKFQGCPYSLYFIPVSDHEITTVRKNPGHKPLMRNGVVSCDKFKNINQYLKTLDYIDEHSQNNYILVHVSNFHSYFGGFFTPLTIGLEKSLRKEVNDDRTGIILAIGILLIMGLYHLGLFSLRRDDKSSLFFGLFCLDMGLWSSLVNRIIQEQFSVPNMFITDVTERLLYASLYLSAPFFWMFLDYIFKSIFPNFIKKALWIISFIFLLSTVFPLRICSYFFSYFTVYFCLFGFLVLFFLMRAFIRRLDDISIALIGFLFILAAGINDFLCTLGITNMFLIQYGIIAFIFVQSYLISKRFSKAFQTAEIYGEKITKQAEQLKKLDKLKDEFLANTSHEIRTPLNGIIGIAESILDGTLGNVSEVIKKNIFMISTSGRRLASLVNDILDFSKLRNNDITLSLKPVDIYVVVDTVIAISTTMIGTKNLIVKNLISDNAIVLADEDRLQQILLNLVGNSIKFTESGHVIITSEYTNQMREQGIVTLHVTDTGIGISENNLDRIFESFEQADGSIERKYGGTGLGLSITKKLIELHGGSIMVKSIPGQGSTFSITLPTTDMKPITTEISTMRSISAPKINIQNLSLHTPPDFENDQYDLNNNKKNDSLAPQLISSLPEMLRDIAMENDGLHILVVDDDAINLQVVTNQLTGDDFTLYTASIGCDALRILKENSKINLVLLDIMMPGMSGYDVCKAIREIHSPLNLPVILLTAKNQVDDLVMGFKIGANDYITKPFAKEELISRVVFHLELSIFSKKLKMTMEELKDLNEHLEHKVAQRTEDLLFSMEELEAAQKTAKIDMKMAINVQKRIFPEQAPKSDWWDMAFIFKPMAGVSGDYYDFYEIDGKQRGISLFDVSGHGIASGLITMIAKSITFRNFRMGISVPLYAVLEQINEDLIEEIGDVGNFLTGVILRFDDRGEIDYVNAGHPDILYKNAKTRETSFILREDGSSIAGKYIGLKPLQDTYESIAFTINSGDYLLLFTDCLNEARNSEAIQFGFDNILTAFKEAPTGSAQDVVDYIYKQFTDYIGSEDFMDDLTIIVIKKN